MQFRLRVDHGRFSGFAFAALYFQSVCLVRHMFCDLLPSEFLPLRHEVVGWLLLADSVSLHVSLR